MSERRDPWDVPAIVAGMEALVARRAELLEAGARSIGWKVALGTEVAMESLGTTGALVGFLTDATLLTSGDACAIGSWTAPKLEPEVAIHLGPGGDRVAAIAPAIELADVDRPPTEIEPVVAGDIYHRRVILGEPSARTSTEPLEMTIERGGQPHAETLDIEAAVGRLDELTTYVARYLERFGLESREGEVIISGATVPLIDIRPGEEYEVAVAGVGRVAVALID